MRRINLNKEKYRYSDAVGRWFGSGPQFSPQLADLAERVFADRHVDARVRPGKIGGAYCYSVVPGLTPYVLLKLTGEAKDIATMAHELGHAVHGMLAEERTGVHVSRYAPAGRNRFSLWRTDFLRYIDTTRKRQAGETGAPAGSTG